jgi:hypothetical protein
VVWTRGVGGLVNACRAGAMEAAAREICGGLRWVWVCRRDGDGARQGRKQNSMSCVRACVCAEQSDDSWMMRWNGADWGGFLALRGS